MKEKSDKLIIELQEWDHACGDGCCYSYGVDIIINGKKIENEDGTNSTQLLRVVLEQLGYTNFEII